MRTTESVRLVIGKLLRAAEMFAVVSVTVIGAAAVPACAQSAQPDILGLKLGDSREQVEEKLRKQFPTVELRDSEGTFGNAQFKTPKALTSTSANVPSNANKPGNAFSFGYSTVQPPAVIAIWRETGYLADDAPSFEETFKAIVSKYGKPTVVVRQATTSIEAKWFLDGSAPDANSSGCAYFADRGMQGSATVAPNELQEMRHCGLFIRAVLSANTDRPALLQQIQIWVADMRLMTKSMEHIQKLIQEGTASAQGKDSARSQKAPL